MPKSAVAVLVVLVILIALPLGAKLFGGPSAPAAGADTGTREVEAQAPSSPNGAPTVVSFDPPNGGTAVSPATKEIRVTFSVPMGQSFSWTGGGPEFPGTAGGAVPYWTPDAKTCVLPVSLRPNASYRCGLNSKSFHNFKSASGIPLTPVVYTFSTGS